MTAVRAWRARAQALARCARLTILREARCAGRTRAAPAAPNGELRIAAGFGSPGGQVLSRDRLPPAAWSTTPQPPREPPHDGGWRWVRLA
jgi:hypothetical protein